LIISYRLQTEN